MGRGLRAVLTADGPCSTGRDAGLGSGQRPGPGRGGGREDGAVTPGRGAQGGSGGCISAGPGQGQHGHLPRHRSTPGPGGQHIEKCALASSAALIPAHEAHASSLQTFWVHQQSSPPYFGTWKIILRVIVRNWWCLQDGLQG